MVELPDNMHGELKKKAASEHTTLKNIITDMIDDYLSVTARPSSPMKKTGLCGIWEDDRPADEIVRDIRSGRTWFTRRKV